MTHLLLALLNALGGVALIIFGVRFLRKGLGKLVGSKLPLWISRLTGGPIRTALTGVGVGVVAPSTSTQGLLVVSLVRDGVLGLRKAVVLLSGAYLGATLLLHLVALDIASYAPIGVLFGVMFFLGTSSRTLRGAGQLILSISFVLMGVDFVGGLATELGESQDLQDIVRIIEGYPIVAIVFAAIVASLVQSSTATLAIFIGFALRDGAIVSDQLILEVVIGANIGITTLALISGWSSPEAKRFSIGVLEIRLLCAAVVLGLLSPIAGLVERLPGSVAQHGAIAHTLFNLACLLLALALARPVEWLVHKMLPTRPVAEDLLRPAPIDERWADNPGMAFTQTKREIALAVRVTTSMLTDAWVALEHRDSALMQKVYQRDETVDRIERHVRSFLTRALTDDIDDIDVRRRLLQLRYICDLETIADVVSLRIGEAIEKIKRRGLWFGDEEWQELRSVFELVRDTLELSGAAFTEEDRALAHELLRMKGLVRDQELSLRDGHYARLQQGNRASIETTDLYVDLLGELKHIAHLASGVAHSVLELKPERGEREPTDSVKAPKPLPDQ